MNAAPLSEKRPGLWREYLRLAWDFARRLSARYKRSIAGPVWLVLSPLALLGIYWLIFGRIFGVAWNAPHPGAAADAGFLLPFFCGLVIYLTFVLIFNVV